MAAVSPDPVRPQIKTQDPTQDPRPAYLPSQQLDTATATDNDTNTNTNNDGHPQTRTPRRTGGALTSSAHEAGISAHVFGLEC